MRLRHAAYYIERVAKADQEYQAGKQQEALAQFDREKGQLDAMRVWLWIQPATISTDTLLIKEALVTRNLGNIRDPMRTIRIPQLERASMAAQRQDDLRSRGYFLGNLGVAYRQLGEVYTAINYYKQYLDTARIIGDRHAESGALGNLGIAYANLGEFRIAIDYYEQSLTIARDIGHQYGEGIALSNIGISYWYLGEIHTAVSYHKQRLVLARETGDLRAEGIALSNLGNAYGDLGEVYIAISYHEQSLVIVREIGDRHAESIVLDNLGTIHYLLEHFDDALAYCEVAYGWSCNSSGGL